MIITEFIPHGYMIAHRAGVGFDPQVNRVISRITGEGNLLGGVIYTNFNGRTVQMHMAGEPGWVTTKMVWIAFDYPFVQLGVEQVLGVVSSTDEKTLDYDQRLGFTEIARIPNAAKDGDIVVLSMLRENCKWLKLRSRFLKANGHAEELAA